MERVARHRGEAETIRVPVSSVRSEEVGAKLMPSGMGRRLRMSAFKRLFRYVPLLINGSLFIQ